MTNYKSLLKDITTFVFDYDGVMTNGDVLITAEGEPLRTANVKDGYAMQLAVKLGYNVAIISGGYSVSIEKRMEMLNVKDVFLRVADKTAKMREYMKERGLKPENIVYVGDDIPDYLVLKMVGLPVCPADAAHEIKDICLYISDKEGGKGCVRDIIEQVLKAQDKWMINFESHLW
ncbi:MAG: HAD hydrolase family protein [Bacteroidales bacterium]|nr:HAD hydrolase family protein [Bacteroidales bacterium]